MFGMITVRRTFGVVAVLGLGFVAYISAASGPDLLVVNESEVIPSELQIVAPVAPLLPSSVAYAVFAATTGEVFFGNNHYQVRPIASITKLFAGAAIVATFDLTAVTTIQPADLHSVGTAGRLRVGEQYTYRDLLFPLLLSSSNNAALVFERRSQGDVVTAMQQWVDTYGTGKTRLADASGLSSGNQASAQELAILTVALRQHAPLAWSISRLTQHLGPYGGWENNSPFIGDVAYRGGKHGFTKAAGRTALVVFAEQIEDVEVEIGYVILGSDDLVRDMEVLRSYVQSAALW